MELTRKADKIIDDVVKETPSIEEAVKPLEELIEKWLWSLRVMLLRKK